MSQKLMGRKAGMTQRFDKDGNLVVCTVIVVEPNVVTQVKSEEKEGYNAVQIGFDAYQSKDKRRQDRLVGKPRLGHFKKAGVEPRRHLMEVRIDGDLPEAGTEWSVDLFEVGQKVDVTGKTKGKGYQGLMKKDGFAGGPAAHGSGFHRRAGSTGMRSTPGWCFKGSPRPSQMGNWQRTVQNLEVVEVDKERNLLLLKGATPGHRGSLVVIGSAIKKVKNG